MADITVTASRVARVFPEKDLVLDFIAGEAVTAGVPVYIASTGKVLKSDANAAGKARVNGIALNAAGAGQAVSVLVKGHLAGYDLSGVAYDGALYLSDTVGALADAPSTTASLRVGRVMPLSDKSLSKVLLVDCDIILPKIFVSAEQTGNGSSQSIAHGLGVIPTQIFIALTGGPAGYTQPTITEGTHTTTNVVVTVTNTWKYRVIAIAS